MRGQVQCCERIDASRLSGIGQIEWRMKRSDLAPDAGPLEDTVEIIGWVSFSSFVCLLALC